MKQWTGHYLNELSKWDRTHRIIGSGIQPKKFWEESMQALASLPEDLTGQCLVDVGAGSGILGFPWLAVAPVNRTVFVERDPKKTAFLVYILSQLPQLKDRALVLNQAIQNVSHETMVTWSPYFLAARAFSGEVSLRDALTKAPIAQGVKKFAFSAGAPLVKNSFILKDMDLD